MIEIKTAEELVVIKHGMDCKYELFVRDVLVFTTFAFSQDLIDEKRNLLISLINRTVEQCCQVVHQFSREHDIGMYEMPLIAAMRAANGSKGKNEEIEQLKAKDKKIESLANYCKTSLGIARECRRLLTDGYKKEIERLKADLEVEDPRILQQDLQISAKDKALSLCVELGDEKLKHIDRLDKEIEELKSVLKKISKGEGRHCRDQHEHACNTIESMKELANAALEGRDPVEV